MTANLDIRLDDLTAPAILDLIRDHLAEMALHSPAESIHALDLDGLRAPDLTFWSAWISDDLIGCAGLRELDRHHGEIKSMRTVPNLRGHGIGRALLDHVIAEATARGYKRLSLETGSGPGFERANGLYKGAGFEITDPFADYQPDPFSVFMTRTLA